MARIAAHIQYFRTSEKCQKIKQWITKSTKFPVTGTTFSATSTHFHGLHYTIFICWFEVYFEFWILLNKAYIAYILFCNILLKCRSKTLKYTYQLSTRLVCWSIHTYQFVWYIFMTPINFLSPKWNSLLILLL